ncbi:MAG: sigma 54-interacting transcriptional regulator, partial [Syntrophales bacterium LBB04]|nr:sigma 54-interacting transcriptional regulator [Syntrophales bacterium LBB04]
KPLFSLDCANPPPVQRESGPTRAGTKDELLLEIAQEAALFGHGANAGSYARGIRKGYLELAEGGALVLANIESLSPYVQSLLVSYLKEGFFVRTGESRKIATKMRLISTSTRTLEELKNLPSLDPELLTLVNGELLKMKPLRERKKDIPIIAEHLVSEYNAKFGKKVTGFSKEALNSLVDHDWPLNIDEMQQVLERATAISEEEVITERQVFLNMPTFSTTGKFNLLSIPFLRKVANYEFFPASLRLVTTPFILALTILTFVGPPQNNPANLIVWAVWWPFLIFSILISARSWCGYCPLPLIADGMNFYRKNFIAVPKFLSKHGLWVGIAGFVLVLLTEHATHMFTTARATSVLLL